MHFLGGAHSVHSALSGDARHVAVNNPHKPVCLPPEFAALEESLLVLFVLLALLLAEELPRAAVQVVPLLRLANVSTYPSV